MQKKKAIIAPSILASDMSRLADECSNVIAKGADWIHVDVMDGHFVNNITLGPPIVKCLRKSLPNVFLDVHMMVENPDKWIADMAAAGASQFTFHAETVHTVEEMLNLCRKINNLNMKVGISVKPNTDIECIYDILNSELIYTVLIMTVEPGFGGQKFLPSMMSKVKNIKQRYPHVNIQVDGGLNFETTEIAAKNGANVIVAGTSIFKSGDISKCIQQMKETVARHM